MVALVVSFVGTLIFVESPLKSIQLIWINLIMDSLASLALATEPPNREKLLSQAPVSRREGLITRKMFKFITFTSLFQIAILFITIGYGPHFIHEQ